MYKTTVKINGSMYLITYSYSYSGTTPESYKPILTINCSDGNWSIYDEWNEWINYPDANVNKDADAPKNKVCLHDWKEYIGFTDKYWYCDKCDAKSEENPNLCF